MGTMIYSQQLADELREPRTIPGGLNLRAASNDLLVVRF